MPLVKIIALEVHRPLPSSVLLEDLVQDGMLGLIKAFREHRPVNGLVFRTYVGNQVRWAMLDGLRASDWAARSVRSGMNKINRAVLQLRNELGREPSKTEIAVKLGIRVEDVLDILSSAQGPQSMPAGDAEPGGLEEVTGSESDPADIFERRQAHSRAVACLKQLQKMERRAYILRELCEMSGRQAAQELGVSESRISQLCKLARTKIAACGSN